MATNRLLLTCRRCVNSITIARLQVGMDDVWLPARVPVDEYERWLKVHSQCGEDGQGLSVFLGSENDIALVQVHSEFT